MFYSQILLGRKGPYGTVWLAAHTQNRLKKKQYTDTNIPETVDRIMFPENRSILSLRLSSHLLLGVVRIYSMKLDILVRDYNLLLSNCKKLLKAAISSKTGSNKNSLAMVLVSSTQVDSSVTLPLSLNLEEFDLENDDTLEREFDNHIGSEEDITLTDQIPTGIDPYVAITFDEDIIQESSPMDIDQSMNVHPGGETDVEMAYEAGPNNGTYGGPRNDTEERFEFFFQEEPNLTEEPRNANSPGSTVPEIEKRRDASAHDLSPASYPPFASQQHSNVRVEHNESSLLDETLSNEKEHSIPIVDEQKLNSSTFELRSGFSVSDEEPVNFVHPSPQLILQPSPSPTPQARPRKRKQQFDKVTILSNTIMKERIEDPSDTLRKRNKLLSSKVDIWRLNSSNQSKNKHQIFNEPLFIGFSDVLRSVFEKNCVASKPYLTVSDETFQENATGSSPTREAETELNQTSPIPQSTVLQSTDVESVARGAQSPRTFDKDDIGIERLRDGGGYPKTEYIMSPPRSSPFRTDDFTTQTGTLETTTYRTEPSTSSVNPEDQTGLRVRNLGLSDNTNEMTMDEELCYLEVGGDNTPASQDSTGLSRRARAFAQYLKECSSSSCGDLSLSKILEGETRNQAAQMFYETMVLKFRGLIDVQQNQPYSDITLKLLPALFSKVQL